jgi:hypothetical protein
MTRQVGPNIMLIELGTISARYSTLDLHVPDDAFVARALALASIEYASALTAENRRKEPTQDANRGFMDTFYMTSNSGTARAAKEHSQTHKEIQLSNFNRGRGG